MQKRVVGQSVYLFLLSPSEVIVNRIYSTIMIFSFLFGIVAAIGIWGSAASGGDEFIAARFLTVAAVVGVGHCFYKALFERRHASY